MTKLNNPRRNRRLWWWSAALLALLALSYGVLWFTVAVKSRDAVVGWIEEQRSYGFTVGYGSLQATGFPFSLRLEFVNPAFAAPPWGWRGERLDILVNPWNMARIRAVTAGRQILSIPFRGGSETFGGEISGAEITLDLAAGWPQGGRLELDRLALKGRAPGTGRIAIERADIIIERLAAGGAGHLSATALLKIAAKGLAGPWLEASPLGGVVQELAVEGRLMGSLGRGPLVETLENWRDSGGTIEVSRLNIRHGPLKIGSEGTLALDGQLQPIGAMTARVEGFFEAIDALQRLKAIKPRDAIAAKMVLGVLSRKPPGGGPATLNLALSAQGRRLYAGPVGLLEIPRVDWK